MEYQSSLTPLIFSVLLNNFQFSGAGELLVTCIDDLTAMQGNRDGVTSYEDIETIISGADLKANDVFLLQAA